MTPSKMKDMPWDETVKICRDYTLTALRTLASMPRPPRENGPGPLRFVYISGHFAPRDKSDIPQQLIDSGLAEVALLRVSDLTFI